MNRNRWMLCLPACLLVTGMLAACSRGTPLAEMTASSPVELRGSHDGAAGVVYQPDCRVYGWVIDENQPDKDLQVRVVVDEEPVVQVLADQYRLDLATFKLCLDGTCAFDVDVWNFISPGQPHTIQVEVLDESNSAWIELEPASRTLTCRQAGGSSLEGTPETTEDPSGRVRFRVGSNSLVLEFLDDDLLHFEYSGGEAQSDLWQPLPTTPMVAKTDYPGPSRLTRDGQGTFETDELRVQVDASTLCLTAWDTTRQPALVLTSLCPLRLGEENQGVTLTAEGFTHAYGLGEAFSSPATQEGDWVGRVRAPGSEMGNAMVGFNGGGVGNAQFPVIYFTGAGTENYALFADHAYAQRWDLKADPWQVTMGGKWMRFYLMSGPDLPDLRSNYLELTGRPPVPPKKMFGLWISEYGYDNWGELEDKLRTLRANQFPVDGFVLDLQWFGGIESNSDDSLMGSLSWDLVNFPDPAGRIAWLRDTQGVGIMTIEESYISKGLPEYTRLAGEDYLARSCSSCPPSYLTTNPWWGKGGMLDWTNTAGAAFWHDWKREPLIEAGVIGHWTDLGEPEMYDPTSWYAGISGDLLPLERHADVHNLFNLLWSQSIHQGYMRNGHVERPFILSRSGAPGSQRYGVAMWSGDIGSNLASLNAQMEVQMHMSLSGMDYFGSDIGGFHRGALDGDLDDMYTQWFANSSLLDVPVRPHTENLCNCKETAPDRIGDLESNLANIRLRYALTPTLYSLAYRAWLYGEPVFPPLVYHYQADLAVRDLVDEKMIGADLLVAQAAGYGLTERTVYLPAGDWYNYHTNELLHSNGEQLGPFPLQQEGRFMLPLFARAGALIPQMYVDEGTMNVFGMGSDDGMREALIVRVYASPQATSFTLYEDDGISTAYQEGAYRTTLLCQQFTGQEGGVTIAASEGEYAGAPSRRDQVVMLVIASEGRISQVWFNDSLLTRFTNAGEWQQAVSGWYDTGDQMTLVRSGEMPVDEDKVFTFR